MTTTMPIGIAALGVSRGASPTAGRFSTSGRAQEASAQRAAEKATLSGGHACDSETERCPVPNGPASKVLGDRPFYERVMEFNRQDHTALSRAFTGQAVAPTALHGGSNGTHGLVDSPRCETLNRDEDKRTTAAGVEPTRKLPEPYLAAVQDHTTASEPNGAIDTTSTSRTSVRDREAKAQAQAVADAAAEAPTETHVETQAEAPAEALDKVPAETPAGTQANDLAAASAEIHTETISDTTRAKSDATDRPLIETPKSEVPEQRSEVDTEMDGQHVDLPDDDKLLALYGSFEGDLIAVAKCIERPAAHEEKPIQKGVNCFVPTETNNSTESTWTLGVLGTIGKEMQSAMESLDVKVVINPPRLGSNCGPQAALAALAGMPPAQFATRARELLDGHAKPTATSDPPISDQLRHDLEHAEPHLRAYQRTLATAVEDTLPHAHVMEAAMDTISGKLASLLRVIRAIAAKAVNVRVREGTAQAADIIDAANYGHKWRVEVTDALFDALEVSVLLIVAEGKARDKVQQYTLGRSGAQAIGALLLCHASDEGGGDRLAHHFHAVLCDDEKLAMATAEAKPFYMPLCTDLPLSGRDKRAADMEKEWQKAAGSTDSATRDNALRTLYVLDYHDWLSMNRIRWIRGGGDEEKPPVPPPTASPSTATALSRVHEVTQKRQLGLIEHTSEDTTSSDKRFRVRLTLATKSSGLAWKKADDPPLQARVPCKNDALAAALLTKQKFTVEECDELKVHTMGLTILHCIEVDGKSYQPCPDGPSVVYCAEGDPAGQKKIAKQHAAAALMLQINGESSTEPPDLANYVVPATTISSAPQPLTSVSMAYQAIDANFLPTSIAPTCIGRSHKAVGGEWIATLTLEVDTDDLIPGLKGTYSSSACHDKTLAEREAAELMLDDLRTTIKHVNQQRYPPGSLSSPPPYPEWGEITTTGLQQRLGVDVYLEGDTLRVKYYSGPQPYSPTCDVSVRLPPGMTKSERKAGGFKLLAWALQVRGVYSLPARSFKGVYGLSARSRGQALSGPILTWCPDRTPPLVEPELDAYVHGRAVTIAIDAAQTNSWLADLYAPDDKAFHSRTIRRHCAVDFEWDSDDSTYSTPLVVTVATQSWCLITRDMTYELRDFLCDRTFLKFFKDYRSDYKQFVERYPSLRSSGKTARQLGWCDITDAVPLISRSASCAVVAKRQLGLRFTKSEVNHSLWNAPLQDALPGHLDYAADDVCLNYDLIDAELHHYDLGRAKAARARLACFVSISFFHWRNRSEQCECVVRATLTQILQTRATVDSGAASSAMSLAVPHDSGVQAPQRPTVQVTWDEEGSITMSTLHAAAAECGLSLRSWWDDTMQRAWFDHIGYGVLWIMPHQQQIICYAPQVTPRQRAELFVALVMWTPGHCEPLAVEQLDRRTASHRVMPSGVITWHRLLEMINPLQSAEPVGFRLMNAGGCGDDSQRSDLPAAGGDAITTNIADLDDSPVMVPVGSDEPAPEPPPPLTLLSTPSGTAPSHVPLTIQLLRSKRSNLRLRSLLRRFHHISLSRYAEHLHYQADERARSQRQVRMFLGKLVEHLIETNPDVFKPRTVYCNPAALLEMARLTGVALKFLDDAQALVELQKWTLQTLQKCCTACALPYSGTKAQLAYKLLPTVCELRSRPTPQLVTEEPGCRASCTPSTSTAHGLPGARSLAAGLHAHDTTTSFAPRVPTASASAHATACSTPLPPSLPDLEPPNHGASALPIPHAIANPLLAPAAPGVSPIPLSKPRTSAFRASPETDKGSLISSQRRPLASVPNLAAAFGASTTTFFGAPPPADGAPAATSEGMAFGAATSTTFGASLPLSSAPAATSRPAASGELAAPAFGASSAASVFGELAAPAFGASSAASVLRTACATGAGAPTKTATFSIPADDRWSKPEPAPTAGAKATGSSLTSRGTAHAPGAACTPATILPTPLGLAASGPECPTDATLLVATLTSALADMTKSLTTAIMSSQQTVSNTITKCHQQAAAQADERQERLDVQINSLASVSAATAAHRRSLQGHRDQQQIASMQRTMDRQARAQATAGTPGAGNPHSPSGLITPVRPGAILPDQPFRTGQRMAMNGAILPRHASDPEAPYAIPVATDVQTDTPEQGFRLAFLTFVATAAEGGQDDDLNFAHMLMGSQWGALCRRNSTPALGHALQQFSRIEVAEPYEPSIYEGGVDQLLETYLTAPLCARIDAMVDSQMARHREGYLDPVMAREMLTVKACVPAPWPKEWETYDAPDYYCLVRVSAGFNERWFEEMRLGVQQVLEHRRLVTRALVEHFGITNTSCTSARRVLSSLEVNYQASDDERPVVNQMFYLSNLQPNLLGGAPQPTPLYGSHRSAEVTLDGEKPERKIIRLKDEMSQQLKSVLAKDLEWNNKTIQFWNLKLKLLFEIGDVSDMLPRIIEHSPKAVFTALRSLLVRTITEKYPALTDSFNQPDKAEVIKRALERFGSSLLQRMSEYGPDSIIVTKNFLESFSQLVLLLRSTPYAPSAELMARQELKRLSQLQKPAGSSDAQWWSEVVRRYRNWATLLGESIMREAAVELRDFLPHVGAQLAEKPNQVLLIHKCQEWLTHTARTHNLTNLAQMLGSDIRASKIEHVMPPLRDGATPPTSTVDQVSIETLHDTTCIWQLGESMRALGIQTDGAQTTYLLLQYTVKMLGESSMAAAAGVGTGDAQLLLANSTSIMPMSEVTGDVMFADQQLPDVGPFNCRHLVGSTPINDRPKKAVQIAAVEQSTTEADDLRNKLAALQERQEQHERSLQAVQRNASEDAAHAAELMRVQLNKLAPEGLGHADNSRVRSADGRPARAMLADAQHSADTRRSNLGVPRPRFVARPGAAPGGERKMRYQNKPPTRWDEVDRELQEHLANSHGMNAEKWAQEGGNACILCGTNADHATHHCLVVFSATERGRKFFGVDKAVQRIKKYQQSRGEPMHDTLASLQTLYFDSCETDAEQDAVFHVWDSISTDAQELEDAGYSHDVVMAQFESSRSAFLQGQRSMLACICAGPRAEL